MGAFALAVCAVYVLQRPALTISEPPAISGDVHERHAAAARAEKADASPGSMRSGVTELQRADDPGAVTNP
jgi:hypothetical protein